MRLGLSTPVVVQVPGMASHWEGEAGIEDLSRIASAADELGFEYLTCSEHVAIPSVDAADRGAVYWEPLATLGFLAARTRRIRLATSVLVLGYHHPLEIAKRYGTLDRVSGGRLVLGVGIGSLKKEFDLIGAPWQQRAARADVDLGNMCLDLPQHCTPRRLTSARSANFSLLCPRQFIPQSSRASFHTSNRAIHPGHWLKA